MPGTILRGVFAGVGHAPVFASLLIVPAAFIVATAGMQTVWPQPTETRPAEQHRSAAEDTKPVPPPAPVIVPVPAAPEVARAPDRGHGTIDGDGVKYANYNLPDRTTVAASDLNAPQIMTADAFNKNVGNGQIYVSSLSDYKETTGKSVTGTPDELRTLDQKFQDSYADAVAAGGTQLTTASGIAGVVVGQAVAQRYGYAAASMPRMQTLASNRQIRAGQQQRMQTGGGQRNAGMHNFVQRNNGMQTGRSVFNGGARFGGNGFAMAGGWHGGGMGGGMHFGRR